MAATKRPRRKRASSVGRTVENTVLELKKSLETLRRMLEDYLPSRTRRTPRQARQARGLIEGRSQSLQRAMHRAQVEELT
jgi:hypothetical protein